MSYELELIDDDRREILRIARATLKEFLRTGRIPHGSPHRKTLTANAGAFVSLFEGTRLRGRTGTLLEELPLYKTIQQRTLDAARDPRYEPIMLDEVAGLTIEITVVCVTRCAGEGELAQVEPGSHGLALAVGDRAGVVLPQAARADSLSGDAMLGLACERAGVSRESASGGRIELFTAIVFDDTTHPPLRR